MIQIEAGMTSTEFLNAINTNSLKLIGNCITVLESMEGSELETIFNSMFDQSENYIGISGNTYIKKLNQIYNSQDYSLDKPTSESVLWVDDLARISFSDESVGLSQHEIWEKVDDNDYTLVTTLGAGVASYDYKTDQNAKLKYRIRAKQGNLFSEFTDILSITSPLVLRSTQIPKVNLVIKTLNFSSGSININWGDGTDNDYLATGQSDITKTYSNEGIYFVQISGDVDEMTMFECYEQSSLAGTDITKWHLPRNQPCFYHLFTNGFIGNITNWRPGINTKGLHLEGNPLDASCVDYLFNGDYTLLWDVHLLAHYVNASNCGDLASRVPLLAHFNIQAFGDITNWRYPKNMGYHSWGITLRGSPTGDVSNLFYGNYEYTSGIELENLGLNGDLSGWYLGNGYALGGGSVKLKGNNFTKCPRGDFYRANGYDMESNHCDVSEIDAILNDIDISVTANTPLYDCTYKFNGTNMGIPTAAGLASKASIEAKYTAAGKTITITVNS